MKSPVSLHRVLSFSPSLPRSLSVCPHLHSPFPYAHIFKEVHEYTPYVLRSEMDSINVGFPTFTRKCGLLLFNQSVIRIFLTSFLSVSSPGFFVLLFIFLFIIWSKCILCWSGNLLHPFTFLTILLMSAFQLLFGIA